MTWSVIHSEAFDTTVSNGRTLPWIYLADTFLPSRGWTVTGSQASPETGGAGTASASEVWRGFEKTLTLGDGTTFDEKLIVEWEPYSNDIMMFGWDGTPGSGATDYVARSDGNGWPSTDSTTRTYYYCGSDQHDDAWMMIADGEVMAFNLPYNGHLYDSLADRHRWVWGSSSGGSPVISMSTTPGFPASPVIPDARAGYSQTYGNVSIFTPHWYMTDGTNNNFTLSHNTLNDVYLKVNQDNSLDAGFGTTNPLVIQVGSNYYLDFNNTNQSSMVFDFGTVNPNIDFM